MIGVAMEMAGDPHGEYDQSDTRRQRKYCSFN
jgi:hypothetical protein